jgi:hypothetical protein
MKKLIAVFLALLFCVSLCACEGTVVKSKGSGVLIEDLQKTIKEFDEDGKLTVTEKEDGFEFKYEGSILLGDLIITGTADKEKNLTQISAKGTSINVSYFNSLTAGQLVKDMNDWEKVAINKLSGEFMLWNFSYIVKICSENNDSEAQMAGLDILLAARNSSKTSNGWTYTVKSDSSADAVTINAVYNGDNK